MLRNTSDGSVIMEFEKADISDVLSKVFRPASSAFSGLVELGFIIVQMDGMGTSNRGKVFHDVCFKNLKDAGFPDWILRIKAAAEKYSNIDPASTMQVVNALITAKKDFELVVLPGTNQESPLTPLHREGTCGSSPRRCLLYPG